MALLTSASAVNQYRRHPNISTAQKLRSLQLLEYEAAFSFVRLDLFCLLHPHFFIVMQMAVCVGLPFVLRLYSSRPVYRNSSRVLCVSNKLTDEKKLITNFERNVPFLSSYLRFILIISAMRILHSSTLLFSLL